MRRFNPERELKKIQRGNKNKIIVSVIALLIIIGISSSYALYQIRYSKRIIYTKVGNFYQNDVVLSVYIDGEKKTEPNSFPDKNSGKIFSHVTCKNGGTGYFDNTKWELNLKTTEQDRCDVYFVTGNLPNEPELFQGMIPVTFSDTGIMYVADTNSDWYNYQDHRWANAVLVDASNATIKAKYFDNNNQLREDIVGKEVPMEEVLQMYVWIPRYKYQLFNVDNQSVPEQIINVVFEKDTGTTGTVSCTYTDMLNGTIKEECQNAENGNWYTHPAFTFGNTNLRGFWVGKFEPSDPSNPIGRNSDISEINILPDKTSMVLKTISTAFIAERNIELQKASKYNLNAAEIDTHMAKNIEWGAIAYLTQSVYGIYKDEKTCNIDGMDFADCEVWSNNAVQGAGNLGVVYGYGGGYTGCVGDSVKDEVIWNDDDGSVAKCRDGYRWNQKGVKASTTGNMYGIYDMHGGAWEYVMGVLVNQEGGGLYLANSDFSALDLQSSKYYDIYTFDSSNVTYQRGHLGDATRETLESGSAWYASLMQFPFAGSGYMNSWFRRGGHPNNIPYTSVFAFAYRDGAGDPGTSFRSILSAA